MYAIGVLCDSSDICKKFISKLTNHYEKSPEKIKKHFDIYFLKEHLKESCVEIHSCNVMTLYTTQEETFKNMIYKSIHFFDCVIKSKKYTHVVRTNMSTLFDLSLLYNNLESWKSLKMLFAGPFIGDSITSNVLISGTCMIMSMDTIDFLLQSAVKVPDLSIFNEDVVISSIMNNIDYNTINVPRLDFITENGNNIILYHKTFISDPDIFCFRFKTNDREHDITQIQVVSDFILKKTDINKFKLPCKSDMPIYKYLFSENPFSVKLS
jgi:hypothetical protein